MNKVNNFDYIKMDVVNSENEIIITSTEFSVIGNRFILHGEDFPLLARNSAVKIIGFSEDGIVPMDGIVTLSIKKQLNINVVEFDEKNERRAYLKVRTDAYATVRRAFMGRSGKGFIINEEVKLRDISVGGICFFSDKVFFVKQRLYIELHEIREGLVVKAIVLRKGRESYTTGFRYRYACRFAALNSVDERILCEYVFKMELENYQKELEKDLNIYD